jgi:hypothetical protein
MAVDIFDPAILAGYASSLVAIVLALYNLYKARESAKLAVSPIIEVGALESPTQKHMLYFPLIISNEGAKAAHLEWIDLYLEDMASKEQYPLYVTKNVEGRKYVEIKSILPLFPIVIPGHSSKSVMIEFTEGKKKPLVFDGKYQANFTFIYNGDKHHKLNFPLELDSSFISLGMVQIKWNQLREHIKDPADYPGIVLFGADMA